MRKMKKGFAMLLMAIVLLTAIPVITSASFTIDGYTSGSYVSMSINVSSPSSPYKFQSYEKKMAANFDNYAYKFQVPSWISGTYLIAFENPSTGNIIFSPAYIGGGSSYTVQLNGNYNIYVFNASSSSPVSYTLEVTAVAPGIVQIIDPDANGYLLKGSTHLIRAEVTGSPTSVVATVIDPGGTSHSVGNLSLSGAYYQLSYTFNTAYSYGSNSTSMPKLRITANYASGGPVVQERPIYVTNNNAAYYAANDSSWTYTSPTNNRFVGVAKSNTACAEYVVGQDYLAQAPAQINQDIIDFMLKNNGIYQNHSSRPGLKYNTWSYSPIAYADAIYYSNYHFARVTAWDSSGNPTEIVSKWGSDELIRSTAANPFVGGIYGNATIYFKF